MVRSGRNGESFLMMVVKFKTVAVRTRNTATERVFRTMTAYADELIKACLLMLLLCHSYMLFRTLNFDTINGPWDNFFGLGDDANGIGESIHRMAGTIAETVVSRLPLTQLALAGLEVAVRLPIAYHTSASRIAPTSVRQTLEGCKDFAMLGFAAKCGYRLPLYHLSNTLPRQIITALSLPVVFQLPVEIALNVASDTVFSILLDLSVDRAAQDNAALRAARERINKSVASNEDLTTLARLETNAKRSKTDNWVEMGPITVLNACLLEASKDSTFVGSYTLLKVLSEPMLGDGVSRLVSQVAIPAAATTLATPFSNAIRLLADSSRPSEARRYHLCLITLYRDGQLFSNLNRRLGTVGFFRIINNVAAGRI
ncbi:hypothetical protein EBR96_03605 [bacterium]|nr:hypothetical protein [bacterium]